MLLIFRKVSFLVGLTLYVICAHSQTVTSTRNGVWSDVSTWEGGVIPSSENATQIIIDHEVELPEPFAVSVVELVVNNKLTLKTGSSLEILTALRVVGTLVNEEGTTLTGTNSSNTVFDAGSLYVHQQGPMGTIPYATWHRTSTFEIAGFKASGYINLANGDSWSQVFGNVVYDCPEQTVFAVELNGHLRNIQGDLIFRNTNNQIVELVRNQNITVSIGGNLIVEGTSRIRFNESGNSPVINIQGDFQYRSTSSGITYFTTSGAVTVNVWGDMVVDTPGTLRMTSQPTIADGRQASLNLMGSLSIVAGQIIAPPLGKGRITFNGSETQFVETSPTGNSFVGDLDFTLAQSAVVSLGNSALSNTSGQLLVSGTLRVGSSDPGGAIQLAAAGNIRIAGSRVFEEGARIVYDGSARQWIGDGHPADPGVDLVCTNPSGVSLLQDVVVGGDFSGSGNIDLQNFTLNVGGDFSLAGGMNFQSGTVRLVGNQNQEVSAAGVTLRNLSINKTGNTSVVLTSPLSIRGVVTIETTNTALNTNGNLTLLSTADDGTGTASVASLPSGSSVTGDITVQRYMSGEGRIYRYISSPVQNATVASLMDDFPVTGTFADPSTGVGIVSHSPSFFLYDESIGGLQAGWRPYPTTGLAAVNPLLPGRGYAAFIRKGVGETVWDVTGILNQGDISLPVFFTTNDDPSNGVNLVGNPYASTIDWDVTGVNTWTKQNISPVIAIRDNGGGGFFHYWDGDDGYPVIPNGHIATGQSFWVRATGPNPVLTIREGAKVTDDAIFYRSKPTQIPGFALVLKQDDGLTDVTYYKVRPDASTGLDDWDAVKYDNDHFDIAIKTEGSITMAINAVDKLPCDAKIIPVEIKDMRKGSYQLSLTTRLEFDQYRYTVIDKFLQKETNLSGAVLQFVVTDDPASYAPDRFALMLDETLPRIDLTTEAPLVICPDKRLEVIVRKTQPGIYYSVWDVDGNQLAEAQIGTGNDLIIRIHPEDLKAGEQALTVKAKSACQEVELLEKVYVVKEFLPEVETSSTRGCQGTNVTLTASSAVEGLTYTWFETATSTDTLSTVSSFEVPPLWKPRTYFFSVATSSGCFHKRLPVLAEIIVLDDVQISWEDATTLTSNYEQGNRWYYNDEWLPEENSQQLTVQLPGVYTLRIDTLGCITSDTVEFFIASRQLIEKAFSQLYPNPVKDWLYIVVGSEMPIDVRIANSSGATVAVFNDFTPVPDNGTVELLIDYLSPGTYYATLANAKQKTVFRFIKED